MQNNFPDKLLTRDQVQAEFGLSRRFLELSAWRGDGPPLDTSGNARALQGWRAAERFCRFRSW